MYALEKPIEFQLIDRKVEMQEELEKVNQNLYWLETVYEDEFYDISLELIGKSHREINERLALRSDELNREMNDERKRQKSLLFNLHYIDLKVKFGINTPELMPVNVRDFEYF